MKVTIKNGIIGCNEVIHCNGVDTELKDVKLVNVIKNNMYIGITTTTRNWDNPILVNITRFNLTVEEE